MQFLTHSSSTASTLLLCAQLTLGSAALLGASPADAPITEGLVEFEIEYEDLGAMAAMLPKSQSLFFRPGQQRIEMGNSVTLIGVEPGQQIQLLDLGGQKIAFVFPEADARTNAGSDLRLEVSDRREEVAGLQARAVDLVDVLDPSNRLPILVTDLITASSAKLHPELTGFALDYYQPMQDGMGHWRAQRAVAQKLDPELFAVPSTHRRIELDSMDQIAAKLQELLGADDQIQVIE